jgi:hypothetical protein
MVECICTQCNILFISERKNKFCNKKCSITYYSKNQKLHEYICTKIKKWKKEYNFNAEEIIEKVSGIKNLTCQYCGLQNLELWSNDANACDKLSIDAMNPGNHNIENLLGCCWLCNRMKNDTPYNEWMKLLSFLKGTTTCLDLSHHTFSSKYEYISKTYKFEPWVTLKNENPDMFKNFNEAKEHFKKLYIQQNGVDGIFQLFPLVLFTQRNIFNVSCDKIDPYCNTEWQLVPCFLNYAKSNYSTQHIINEFQKRNFLKDTKKLSIILPDNYNETSVFYAKVFENKKYYGKGANGIKRNEEVRKHISESKKGNNYRSKPVISIDKDGNEMKFISLTEACKYYDIKISGTGSISLCAHGKQKTAYGFKWKFISM